MTGTTRFVALTLRIASLATLVVCFQHMTRALNDIQHTTRHIEVLPSISQSNGTAKRLENAPLSIEGMLNVQLSTMNATAVPKRRRKRGRRKRKVLDNSDDKEPPPPLKVPLPIFVPSLPKSGTTSVHNYFLCGGQKSAHHVYRIDGQVKNKIGRCVKRNVARNMPPFQGCGDTDIWTDTGFVAASYQKGVTVTRSTNEEEKVGCYYPLIEALDEIYEQYPNATILFVIRDEDAWLNSIQHYHDGFIFDIWKQCKTKGFPGMNATLEDFRSFYRWHQQLIRDFASSHPSMTYIEVPLEPESTASVLEESTGVSADCWGHYNKLKKRSPKQMAEE